MQFEINLSKQTLKGVLLHNIIHNNQAGSRQEYLMRRGVNYIFHPFAFYIGFVHILCTIHYTTCTHDNAIKTGLFTKIAIGSML